MVHVVTRIYSICVYMCAIRIKCSIQSESVNQRLTCLRRMFRASCTAETRSSGSVMEGSRWPSRLPCCWGANNLKSVKNTLTTTRNKRAQKRSSRVEAIARGSGREEETIRTALSLKWSRILILHCPHHAARCNYCTHQVHLPMYIQYTLPVLSLLYQSKNKKEIQKEICKKINQPFERKSHFGRILRTF